MHLSNLEKVEIPASLVINLTQAQPRLFNFLLKRLGRRDQAHEVLQEVNLTICRKCNEFEEGTNFMAWAFSISRFQAMAFRKKQARDRHVFPADLIESIELLDNRYFPASAESDRQLALSHCLKKLSPENQGMIISRYAESETVKAIAANLGRTVNAVSIVLHRVRKQLHDCINIQLAEGVDG